MLLSVTSKRVGAAASPEVRDGSRDLLVVSLLRIAGAEIRCVIHDSERVRKERRIENIRACRPAVALELEAALGILPLDQHAASEDASIVREVIRVWQAPRDEARGVGDKAEKAGRVRHFARVVEVTALNSMVLGDGARQLQLSPFVLVRLNHLHSGLPDGPRIFDRLIAACREEPEMLSEDRAAEGAFVGLLQVIRAADVARHLEALRRILRLRTHQHFVG